MLKTCSWFLFSVMAAAFLSCNFDQGLGVLESKISGKVYFLGTDSRPQNVDEVRVVAAANFPPQGFGDVFFSEAIPFAGDSAAYEMPLPVDNYPAVAVLWKPRGEDWNFTSLLGFYGFDPRTLSARLQPVNLTNDQPVADHVDIVALWSFAQFDAHVEGEITFQGQWPEDTEIVLLGAFNVMPNLNDIVNSLVFIGGIDFAGRALSRAIVIAWRCATASINFLACFGKAGDWRGIKFARSDFIPPATIPPSLASLRCRPTARFQTSILLRILVPCLMV
ncbi:hypothetical protein DCC62_32875 [candidate division KSB1 bacterium]|nr:MAG: hypothetical protein DCC62_32875 [candidate division KSB1 bacterium]